MASRNTKAGSKAPATTGDSSAVPTPVAAPRPVRNGGCPWRADDFATIVKQHGGIAPLEGVLSLLNDNAAQAEEADAAKSKSSERDEKDSKPRKKGADDQDLAALMTAAVLVIERHERTKFPASVRLTYRMVSVGDPEEQGDTPSDPPAETTGGGDQNEEEEKEEEGATESNGEASATTQKKKATLSTEAVAPSAASNASSNNKAKPMMKREAWLVIPEATKGIAACANESYAAENGKRAESWQALELLYHASQEQAVEEAQKRREEKNRKQQEEQQGLILRASNEEDGEEMQDDERMGSQYLRTLLVARSSCDDTRQDLLNLHKRLVLAASYYVRQFEELAPRALSLASFSLVVQRPCSGPLLERMIEALLPTSLRSCWRSGRWALNMPKAQEVTNRVSWMIAGSDAASKEEVPDILHDLSTSQQITELLQSTPGAVRSVLDRVANSVGLSLAGALRWSAPDLGRILGAIPSGRLTLNNCLSSIELDVACHQRHQRQLAIRQRNGGGGDINDDTDLSGITSLNASLRMLPKAPKSPQSPKTSGQFGSFSSAEGESECGKQETVTPPTAAVEKTAEEENSVVHEEETSGESTEVATEMPEPEEKRQPSLLRRVPQPQQPATIESPVRRATEPFVSQEEKKGSGGTGGLEVVLQDASDSNSLADLAGLELLRQVANEEGLTSVRPSPAPTPERCRTGGTANDSLGNTMLSNYSRCSLYRTDDPGLEVVLQHASESNSLSNLGGLELLRQVANEQGLTEVPPSFVPTKRKLHMEGQQDGDQNHRQQRANRNDRPPRARLVSGLEAENVTGLAQKKSSGKKSAKGKTTLQIYSRQKHDLPWQPDTQLNSVHLHAVLAGISVADLRAAEMAKDEQEAAEALTLQAERAAARRASASMIASAGSSVNFDSSPTKKLLGAVITGKLRPGGKGIKAKASLPLLLKENLSPTRRRSTSSVSKLPAIVGAKKGRHAVATPPPHSLASNMGTASPYHQGHGTSASNPQQRRSQSSMAFGSVTGPASDAPVNLAAGVGTAVPKGKPFQLPPLRAKEAYGDEASGKNSSANQRQQKPVGLESLLQQLLVDGSTAPTKQETSAKKLQKQSKMTPAGKILPKHTQGEADKGQPTKQQKEEQIRERKRTQLQQKKQRANELDEFIHRESRNPKDSKPRPLKLDV